MKRRYRQPLDILVTDLKVGHCLSDPRPNRGSGAFVTITVIRLDYTKSRLRLNFGKTLFMDLLKTLKVTVYGEN